MPNMDVLPCSGTKHAIGSSRSIARGGEERKTQTSPPRPRTAMSSRFSPRACKRTSCRLAALMMHQTPDTRPWRADGPEPGARLGPLSCWTPLTARSSRTSRRPAQRRHSSSLESGSLFWAAGGAVMAAAAIALASGSSPTRVANAPRTTITTRKAPSTTRIATGRSHPDLTSRAARRSPSNTQPRHRTKRRRYITATTRRRASRASWLPRPPSARRPRLPLIASPRTSTPYTPPAPAPAPEGHPPPAGTNASAAESSSTNRPAFGANGLLGPGHSPDG